ncbi:MAG: thioredoxin-dependent thiol peroxidase [Candidatus Thermoplasmatota archaeon]|nr:thioredoxin-dependent thiol peroxidase [Candidatus Thermoplasmatota archaeon]MCL5665244.1 thioredoxin-dependent thiol peroxidase [Candidatus Thermoplasmatota archaeon]
MADVLKVGERAPDFESVDHEGKRVSLKDFRGKPVVVYFYPKDDTPGCTTEACGFRDRMGDYEKRGVKVLGISVDSQKSHKKFQEKYGLNFTLVADDKKEISSKYGVLGGNTASRVTYLIDKDGIIRHVYPRVSPKEHPEEVMKKLEELGLVR